MTVRLILITLIALLQGCDSKDTEPSANGQLESSVINTQASVCGEVSITEMNWDSAQVVTAVAKRLMEQGYGCSVELVPSTGSSALLSLSNTGKPDILTELWTNFEREYSGLLESGKIEPLTDVLPDGGVEGWWVPTYLLEEHPSLATLDGVLANPELVEGRFYNCPVGWVCHVINTNMAGMAFSDGTIENYIPASADELVISIQTAFENNAPWFGYYWAPTFVSGKYPMTMIDIGSYDASVHQCNGSVDCATPTIGAYPKSIVKTVVSKPFVTSNPQVTDMMRNLSFTNEQMGELLVWKKDNDATADQAAIHFLTNYNDIWPSWVSNDAKARLSSFLN